MYRYGSYSRVVVFLLDGNMTHPLNRLDVGKYISFVKTRPNVVGEYMTIVRIHPNGYLVLRNDDEIVLYPRKIARRFSAGQNIRQIVQRHRLMTRAETLAFIPFINRNYTMMPYVSRSANRRARIN